MIRALLVDDERLALMHLEKILKEFENIEIIDCCMDPVMAMKIAHDSKPNVIFLDIHMPEMNGMKAAELIQKACPGADIVFVTAYDEYALHAFEINALDYVLKPIRRNRLKKTIERLEERLALPKSGASPSDESMIRVFQTISYDKGNERKQPFKWRTSKAQELFAYLLHHRNRYVNRDILLEVLWPDFELKKAATHLYTTIYQMRQCLKQAGLNVHINNVSGGDGYTLDMKEVILDVDEWENGIRKLGSVELAHWPQHQKLFELYSGEYYGDYDFIWAESERERLRAIWLHHAVQLAKSYCANNRVADGITVYKRLVELQPFYEEGYWGLMKLYAEIGDHAAVEAQFRLLQTQVADELGITIQQDILHWYEDWRRVTR